MIYAIFRRQRRLLLVGVGLAAAATALASAAQAETLSDAIGLAYHTNPAILGQRATLRITDEAYVQARAGYRPDISVQVSGARQDYAGLTSNNGSALIVANQPIYSGGRVAAAVSAAEADILAGRETLRATEAALLQAVVQVYADVLRDQEFLAIREANLEALNGQLKEVRARSKAGDVTRTDVAQAQGYVSQAKVDLASAKAQLATSQANYASVVGQAPDALAPLPTLPNLPENLAQAQRAGENGNATVRAALYAEQAARLRTAEAQAQKRPQVSLRLQYGPYGPLSAATPNFYPREAAASATFTLPLFAGGVLDSQVRQQRERQVTAASDTEQARRTMHEQIIQAWNVYQAGRQNMLDADEEVRANGDAYEGAQKERRADLRSTFEVLYLEQSLRQAELVRASARHDSDVAGATLLQAMGLLEADLVAPVTNLYDPVHAFKGVKNRGAVPWEPGVAILDQLASPALKRLPPEPRVLPDGG